MREKKGIAWLIIFAIVIGVFSPVGPVSKAEAKNIWGGFRVDSSGNAYHYYVSASADATASSNAFNTLEAAFDHINNSQFDKKDNVYVHVTGTVNDQREAIIRPKCHVIVVGEGGSATIKRGRYFEGSIINVDSESTFADFSSNDVEKKYDNHFQMKDITLDGGIEWETSPEDDPLGRSGEVASSSIVKPVPIGDYKTGYMGAAFKLTAGDIRLIDCTIQNNYNDHPSWHQVTKDGEYMDPSRFGGGGIYIDENGVCNLDGCIISNNYSRHQGGGIWKHGFVRIDEYDTPRGRNTVIYGNRADDWGGGIYQYDGRSIIYDVVVRNNSAKGSGGGMCFRSGSFEIYNATICSNYIEGEAGNADSAMGGAGIRIEDTISSVPGNNGKEFKGTLIVSGNAGKALKDGKDGLNAASGVMIDIPVAASGNASGNAVELFSGFSGSVNGNYVLSEGVQYDTSTNTYVASGDAVPEYNVGYVGMDTNPKPAVTVSGEAKEYTSGDAVSFHHYGDTETLTVDVTNPSSGDATPSIAYQWYVASADGIKKKIDTATKNTYALPSDEKGVKYYSCGVSYQVDKNKLPAKVMTDPVEVTIHGLKANNFIVSKDALSKWTSMNEAIGTSYADLRWGDNAAVSGNASAKPKTSGETMAGIIEKGNGVYTLTYSYTYPDNKVTTTEADMYVTDASGEITDDSNNVLGVIGANDIIISSERAKEIMDDQNAQNVLKEALGIYVIKNGVIDNSEMSKVTIGVPDDFDEYGERALDIKYNGKKITAVSATVVKIEAADFFIKESELKNLASLDTTKSSSYADVKTHGPTGYSSSIIVDKITYKLDGTETERDISLEEIKRIGVGNNSYKTYKVTYKDVISGASFKAEMLVVPDSFFDFLEGEVGSIRLSSSAINLKWTDIIGKDNNDEELQELLMKEGEPVAERDGKPYFGDPITIDKVNIFDENHNFVIGMPHDKHVIFKCGSATTISDVMIYSNPPKFPLITAKDFIISVEDAKSITTEAIITKSNARYFTSLTDRGDSGKVSVTDESLRKLKAVQKADDVKITFTNISGIETCENVEATVHVVDSLAAGTGTNSVMTIGASNIVIEKSDIPASLDEQKTVLLNLGNPIATDRSMTYKKDKISVDKVDIYEADNITLKEAPAVTFTYRRNSDNAGSSRMASGEGVSIKVPIKVLYRTITASDFWISVEDGELTEAAFKEKANVKAFNQDGEPVTAKVDSASLASLNDAIAQKTPGKYLVKVKTASDKEPPCYVTVRVIGTGTLEAGDFIITKTQLDNMKDIKETIYEGYAYVGKNGRPVTSGDGIVVESVKDPEGDDANLSLVDLKLRGAGHSYIVTYKDENTDASITVDMMVIADISGGAVSGDANVITIEAERILAEEKDILGKDEEELEALFMDLGKPRATYNGQEVPTAWIKVSSMDIFDITNNNLKDGPSVTFEFGGQTYTSTVMMVGEPLQYPVLFANDFVINVNDAKKANDNLIKQRSSARYYKEFTDKSDTAGMVVAAAGKTALNNAKAEDKVSITFTVNGNKSKTVTAYVVDKTEIGTDSDSHEVVFGANNITIDKSELPADGAALKAKLKSESKPIATDKGVLIPTADTRIKVGEVELYESDNVTVAKKPTVTFEYDGVEVTVPITVTGLDGTASGDASGNGAASSNASGNGTASSNASGNGAGNSEDEKAKEELTFDISDPKDIVIGIEPGKVVDTVVIDGATLPDGDYTIDGDKLIIKNEAFIDKAEGAHSIEVSFKDGTKKIYTINVVPFDEKTVVPLNKVPILNMTKTIGVGKKYKLNLVGLSSKAYIDPKKTKSSNKKIATIDPKTLVIKGKKEGKCNIQVAVVQNGSYYSVKLKVVVKKGKTTYNIKKKALAKKKGNLPEYNVHVSVKKGKKTKLKFSQLDKTAKVKYSTNNKKIAAVSKKGVIKGKKKGFAKITARIEQNGHTYYTRVLVQVNDNTKNKQIKKYLTKKLQ